MILNDENYHKGAWEHNYLTEARLGGEEPNRNRDLAEILSLLQMTGTSPGASRLLDIGCGTGRNAVPLAQLGYLCTGIDSSEEALRRARGRATGAGLAAEFTVGDCLGLRQFFTQSSYDVVLDAYTFHVFVTDRDRQQHLHNVHWVLRPGGYVIVLGAHDEDAPQGHVESFDQFCRLCHVEPKGVPAGRFAGGKWETAEHERFFLLARPQSMAGYCAEFADAGFDVIHKELFGEPGHAAFVLRKRNDEPSGK